MPAPPPESASDLLRQASWLVRSGQGAQAASLYRRALAIDPARPDDWFNYGNLLQALGQPEASLDAYAQALAHGITQPEEVHLNRAVVLAGTLARPGEALQALSHALDVAPAHVPSLLNLGHLHEQAGRREQAIDAYAGVLAAVPGHALAMAKLVTLQPLTGADDPILSTAQAALDDPARPDAERADLGYALGQALDRLAHYDAAFAAYAAGNAASARIAAARGYRYDRRATEALIDRLIATFPLAGTATAAAGEPLEPLFICGLFRSGSTLVERMIAQWPGITAGGESPLIPTLADHVLGSRAPEAPRNWPIEALQAWRSGYLQASAARYPSATVLTDKRPDNVLWVGLIKAIFPEARIVITRRHPLDNGLALYFLHLSHAMPWATDLGDIGHWSRQVDRLVNHWAETWPDTVHRVDYDRLVSQPARELPPLARFCGVSSSDEGAALRFHEAQDEVGTASMWQVRHALYTTSSGRWQRYEQHLVPLRQALEGG